RLNGPTSLFVVHGPLGLRLVHVEPLMSTSATEGAGAAGSGARAGRRTAAGRAGQPRRLGAIVAEQPLSSSSTSTNSADREGFPLATSIGPVTLRQAFAGRPSAAESSLRFTLRAPTGEALVETIVPANAAETLRARWRRTVNALIFTVLGVTVLLVASSCV